MPIGESVVKTAVFIGSADGERRLRGTGFVVAIPSRAGGDYAYVVTAAHVVRRFTKTFARVRRHDGTIDDLDIAEWTYHPTHDVAAAHMHALYPATHDLVAVPERMFSDTSEHAPMLGEEVYFMGLLGQVASMGSTLTPMVRTGTLGALDQPEVPMIEPPNTRRALRGHLIDCRSFGGFSGSPCFMPLSRPTGKTERLGLPYPQTHPILLGMIGGHFDHRTSIRLPDDRGDLSVPTSAGVGVVYPAEIIREALDLEELADRRAYADARTPKILAIKRTPQLPGHDGFSFAAFLADPGGGEDIPLTLEVSRAVAHAAGFDDAPSTAWIADRFVNQVVSRVDPDQPLATQVRSWESPFVIVWESAE